MRVRAISAGELKEALSARGLGTSGKKAELVGKLREALENPPAWAAAWAAYKAGQFEKRDGFYGVVETKVGKQKAEPDADVEDEAPVAKKPKGKQKAEPDAELEELVQNSRLAEDAAAAFSTTLTADVCLDQHVSQVVSQVSYDHQLEAWAKMSMGTLALTSCLPHACMQARASRACKLPAHACAVWLLTLCVCVQSPQASSRRS